MQWFCMKRVNVTAACFDGDSACATLPADSKPSKHAPTSKGRAVAGQRYRLAKANDNKSDNDRSSGRTNRVAVWEARNDKGGFSSQATALQVPGQAITEPWRRRIDGRGELLPGPFHAARSVAVTTQTCSQNARSKDEQNAERRSRLGRGCAGVK